MNYISRNCLQNDVVKGSSKKPSGTAAFNVQIVEETAGVKNDWDETHPEILDSMPLGSVSFEDSQEIDFFRRIRDITHPWWKTLAWRLKQLPRTFMGDCRASGMRRYRTNQ